MRHADIIVGSQSNYSLDDFSKKLFSVLSIAKYELRDSENYVQGHYYIGKTERRRYWVMLSPNDTHRDSPYWVQIDPLDGNDSLSEEELTDLATRLQGRGFSVARVENFGRRNEARTPFVVCGNSKVPNTREL